jgi:hypothetical protein
MQSLLRQDLGPEAIIRSRMQWGLADDIPHAMRSFEGFAMIVRFVQWTLGVVILLLGHRILRVQVPLTMVVAILLALCTWLQRRDTAGPRTLVRYIWLGFDISMAFFVWRRPWANVPVDLMPSLPLCYLQAVYMLSILAYLLTRGYVLWHQRANDIS